MLVLTRTEGEAVLIGDNIRVTVSRVDGAQIRIGIEAPPAVGIVRGELLLPADECDLQLSPEFAFD